ncbi:hypothetical protein [Bacteroides congonensis]|uniref:hypothetical protein n=1 Tax=Bacteroides congonensis TaxID=1871006 RepID=UPI0032190BE2
MCRSFEILLNKENLQSEVRGKTEERAKVVLELLEDIGEPSEILRNYIMERTDLEMLRGGIKLQQKRNYDN